MIEPALPLHLQSLGAGPGRVGLVFGVGAVASAMLHPWFGHLADRLGARRMTLYGLVVSALALALLGQTWSYQSTLVLFAFNAGAGSMVITPSLAYMAAATSAAGIESFGVAYGVYNMAWGAGLLTGPALGGLGYERMGFSGLTLAWAPSLLLVTWLVARVKSNRSPVGTSKETI
jgi:MFS family permease